MSTTLLNEVTAFIWAEADMLDHHQYEDWLSLWREDGLYIVPIDRNSTDYENTLNYAYDNARMRRMRVNRLTGGESISTSPEPRTVRMVSRLRIIDAQGDLLTVRAAQYLTDFRKEAGRHYVADLGYTLQKTPESFAIVRKIVKLINSDDVLETMGYIP